MDTIEAQFAERLRALRKEKELTQAQAAAIFNVTSRHWQKLERYNGENLTNVRRLVKIADFFGVSIDYLLGRRSDK